MAFDFQKLRTAIDWSITQLNTPRQKRLDAIRQYVGNHYGDDGSDKRVPTNFLELAVTIYTRQLAARAPRVMVSAKNQQLRPFARTMELAINQIPDEIDLGHTMQQVVTEAMFSFGVVKVGLEQSGNDAGQVFVDLVSVDDYFCDMSAKSRKLIQYEGNDYWVPYEVALDMGLPKGVEPDKHTLTGDQGDTHAASISSSEGADLYQDMVWLRDVWIPSEQKLITYAVKSLRQLKEIEWNGPNTGPYHMLGFSEVPGNLLPLPPVALWRDLHELGNNLFRKLGRQADAKKTVAAFQGGNDSDVEALKQARDGEGIRYSGQTPENISVGGVDAPSLAFYLQVRDLFSYFSGNIDSLGGLAPQTETVGQDRMLGEAASTRLKHMADETIKFAKNVFKDVAWYEWTNPLAERQVQKHVEGTNISVDQAWSYETRQGDFLSYNFDIDAYSMQDDSPSTKMQKIGLALERFIFPVLESLEGQGGQIDFKKLTEMIARFGNIPELNDIVQFRDPPDEPEVKGHGQPTRKPSHTHRTVERVNRPGATRHGKDDVMSRILMGAGVQDSEAASLGRMVS